MSTFSYRGFTLNGYRNAPYYDTELNWIKAVLDMLPQSGTTSVTTEHHHSRLASPSADVSAITCSESGVLNLPLLAAGRGVLVKNAAGDIGVTTAVFGYIESPGAGRIPYGSTTGMTSSANITWDAANNELTVNGNVASVRVKSTAGGYSNIWMGATGQGFTYDDNNYTMGVIAGGITGMVIDGQFREVYTTRMATYTPSYTGISAVGSTGVNCFYTKLGRMVDTTISIGGESGIGTMVRIGLPIAADITIHDERFRWLLATNEAGTLKVGTAKLDTGCTGLLVFADGGESGSEGWFGSAGLRKVSGTIRYYSV